MRQVLLVLLMAGAGTVRAQVTFDAGSLHRVYGGADGFYSYAPSVIDDGETRYVWACHNHDAFVVRDNIALTTFVGGKLVDERTVLTPAFMGWDSFHLCDPSVMRSDIPFNKVAYRWVMFFLGNDVDGSARNQIGVALSESVVGPWEKMAEPVVRNSGGAGWGVGQPSAVPLDGKGKFLLVYSGGGLHAVTVDLSDLRKIVVSQPVEVTTRGLELLGGGRWPLTNMDIALSADGERIYAVADVVTHETTAPTFITSRLAVVSIGLEELESGTGAWTVEGVIGPKLTGFPRNHNAGLERREDGRLSGGKTLSVIFTRSCAAGSDMPCKGRPEWSYELWEISGRMR